jgi:hypothetical protein
MKAQRLQVALTYRPPHGDVPFADDRSTSTPAGRFTSISSRPSASNGQSPTTVLNGSNQTFVDIRYAAGKRVA